MNATNAIAKKLLIKPGQRWLFYNPPPDYLVTLGQLPDGVEPIFVPIGKADGIQLFAHDSKDLAAGLKAIAPILTADTVLWITYPKKSSGITSDMEMRSTWNEPTKYGLTPVAAAAIDEIWTAIRLKPQGQSKSSEFGNNEIKSNEYGAFIDVDARQIHLPLEMKDVLDKSPSAMAFYQSLSFTNKKEYVVWVLSAKQEKTKAERLVKLLGKLLDKKKNPSEK